MGQQDANIIGKKYGKLTVIKTTQKKEKTGQFFLCQCDCGNNTEKSYSKLNNGGAKSCGCLLGDLGSSRTIDLTGQIFGKWTVIEIIKKPENTTKKKKGAYWKCKCACGSEKIIYGTELRNGHTKSCGCGKAEETAERNRKYEPWFSSAKYVFINYSDGDLAIEKFIELSKLNCFYCGMQPKNRVNIFDRKSRKGVEASINEGNFIYNGLDRIDSAQPHNLDNIVPCCKWCNAAKLDRSEQEFKEWSVQLYNNYTKTFVK